MLDKPLKNVKSFKELGVTISKDLSRDNHISITVNKANNQLELIKRSVSTTNVRTKDYLNRIQCSLSNREVWLFEDFGCFTDVHEYLFLLIFFGSILNGAQAA